MKKIAVLFVIMVSFIVIFTSCSETECITEAKNKAPSCRIVTPEENSTIEKGPMLVIIAEADDSDGYITEVRFFINGTQEASVKEWPYSFQLATETLSSGSCFIKIEAVDNDGAKTADSVEVRLNSFPECFVVYPPDNTYFFAGDEIEIKVSASDEEVSKSVSKVTFYLDSIFLSEDTEFPYSTVWTMTQGSHIITAEVSDDAGSVFSHSVTVHTDKVIQFPDPAFEQAVRMEIMKPEGDICASDVGNIIEFHATYQGISNISGIENFRSVEKVQFYANQISDISPLKDLKKIRTISIFNNKISDISYLREMFQLEGLSIGENLISDISPLRELKNLEHLNLSVNDLNDISALKNLVNLKDLDLSSCNLTDISQLSGLTNIQQIILDDNAVFDIKPLAFLVNIEYLSLSDNDIEDISPLSAMPRLRIFRIVGNRLRDISSLRYLPELNYLYLSDNLIADIYPLFMNQGIAAYDYVDLMRNELNSVSVNSYIPALLDREVNVSW
jgi:hypothetical protein